MTINWNRRLVPKWSVSTRPVRIFDRKELTVPVERPVQRVNTESRIQEALDDFDTHPSLGVAADALRLAVDPESKEALKKVALYVAEYKKARVPEWLRRAAEAIAYGASSLPDDSLKGEEDLSPRQSIHLLRRRLRAYPANPLGWMDYARLQTTKGNNEAASSAIKVALELAPNSRFVLRSAARFYLHVDDPERALFILNRTQRTGRDPWLMAGHISVNAILGRSSKLVKQASAMVASDSLPPSELTELAAALATLELSDGRNKAAKKLFDISLRAPNDNSLAQAEWASRILKMRPDFPAEWLSDPTLAEAAYYRVFLEGEFETAIRMARNWHDDEPFASRPMISASFLAGIMGRMYDAESYAKMGLVAEPNNVVLLNNYVFALTSLGNYTAAVTTLKKIALLEKRRISGQTLANVGFITYLSGDYRRGAQFYRAAINGFKKMGKMEELSSAAAFHFRAAKMSGAPDVLKLEEEALLSARIANSILANRIVDILVKNKSALPDRKLPPAILKQEWLYDPETNLLTFDTTRR